MSDMRECGVVIWYGIIVTNARVIIAFVDSNLRDVHLRLLVSNISRSVKIQHDRFHPVQPMHAILKPSSSLYTQRNTPHHHSTPSIPLPQLPIKPLRPPNIIQPLPLNFLPTLPFSHQFSRIRVHRQFNLFWSFLGLGALLSSSAFRQVVQDIEDAEEVEEEECENEEGSEDGECVGDWVGHGLCDDVGEI